MISMKCNVSVKISNACYQQQVPSDCIYTCSEVKDAVSHLKAHKRDGTSGLSSDHIINASDLFFTHLALLFTTIVIHGGPPDSFLLSTVVPMPNDNNVNKSVQSFLAKYLAQFTEKYSITLYYLVIYKLLASFELQFGFKVESSTNFKDYERINCFSCK